MYQMNADSYNNLIDLALEEDLGQDGDVTSAAIFSEESCTARLISKDKGVLAGSSLFAHVFQRVDQKTTVEFYMEDSARLHPMDMVASLRGRTANILKAERTALNFISLLSGIATTSREYAEAASRYGKARILDTRKTIPGYRKLSKYAAKIGGALNHRKGLFDMVIIKDNHIDGAGSVSRAVERVRRKWGTRFKIEVECRNLEEVEQALTAQVDFIMLDNMNPAEIKDAVHLVKGRAAIEASGNMDLKKVKELSASGVDYISVGRLTHSIRNFDFSLLVDKT